MRAKTKTINKGSSKKMALKEKVKLSNRVASPEIWQERVWHALRHLDDRSILNQSPLARLTYIQRLAQKEFKGNALVRGLALKYVLTNCIDRIIAELGTEAGLIKECEFLKMVKQGHNLSVIGKLLGLSREHITRTYKKKAVELVTQEFLYLIGHPNIIYREIVNRDHT